MLNRLDENIKKLLLLDLNVSHVQLDENASNFYFGQKCEYVLIGC